MIVVVDLRQASRTVSEPYRTGDADVGQSSGRAAAVGVGYSQRFGQRLLLQIRIVDVLDHARQRDAGIVVNMGRNNTAVSDHALPGGD